MGLCQVLSILIWPVISVILKVLSKTMRVDAGCSRASGRIETDYKG